MEVIGSVLGGAIAADGATDAASIQANATREANQILRDQQKQVREDLSPWRNTGASANSLLARLLGVSSPSTNLSQSYEQIRNELLPQFTRQVAGPMVERELGDGGTIMVPGASVSQVDENALAKAVQDRMAQNASLAAQQATSNANDPQFGSLLKPFTGKDMESEPGYQFGRNQGLSALDRRLASGGQYFSGAALKAGQRFAQDYAGTKFGEAYNRDAANKRMVYDFLGGQSTAGQNSAAGTATAGTQMANTIAGNTTAMGNASGAASIAGANALGGAVSGGINGYQRNQLMERLLQGNRGWGSGGGWMGGGRTVPDYPGAEY